MIPRGVYRERNGWADGQNSVLVDYGKEQTAITEDKYRENRYQPPFNELAWKGGEPNSDSSDGYIHDVEERLTQLRNDLEPMETGKIQIGRRQPGQRWAGTTRSMIASHKRTIAVYEAILAKLRKDSAPKP